MSGFYLEAPAIAAPGLPDWQSASPVLAGKRPYQAAPLEEQVPDILPPTAQRRGSASTLLAARVAQETLADSDCNPEDLATVFASSLGDPQITDQLCRALAMPSPMLSPTRFHNSVHNAPAGYWNIATGSMQPGTSLAAHDASFAAGLLSASAQCRAETCPVMLVAYDLPYAQPLNGARPLSALFATALVLTPRQTRYSRLHAELSLSVEQAATGMPQPQLESLRLGNPAARALPLLALLAAPAETRLNLEYLPGSSLELVCRPC